MKIGIVIRTCKNVGSSRYILETSKYFAKQHEVHIFANQWDQLDEKIHTHKIHIVPGNFYLREASFYFFATLLLKRYKFDVTLAQPTRYNSPDIAEMQFVNKAWTEYKKSERMPLTLQDKIMPRIETSNIKKAKAVIALSESVKNEVVKYHSIEPEKIHVVYSGVDSQTFTPENRQIYSDEIRAKHNLTPDQTVLVFAGNPFERKGLEYVLRAASEIQKNTTLLVLGKYSQAEYNQFTKIAEEVGVKDKTIFVGLTKDISKYFAASDIFVLPTLYEPFGLVILEAMASGLPVITSKLAGAAELITDGKDGMLLNDPKDVNDISEKLNYLINDKVSRENIAKAARATAEKYTWERTAKGMLEVFEKVGEKKS